MFYTKMIQVRQFESQNLKDFTINAVFQFSVFRLGSTFFLFNTLYERIQWNCPHSIPAGAGLVIGKPASPSVPRDTGRRLISSKMRPRNFAGVESLSRVEYNKPFGLHSYSQLSNVITQSVIAYENLRLWFNLNAILHVGSELPFEHLYPLNFQRNWTKLCFMQFLKQIRYW